MAVNGGPKIPKDGLVLNLDAANLKSNRGRRGIINWNNWTSGSGGVTGYGYVGALAENRRIWDTNPFGNIDIVWDTPSNDVTSDADGGYSTVPIAIDPTKMYRFSTWVRRPTVGNGNFYLGTHGFTDTTNTGVLYRTDSAQSTTNPYFRSSGWWGSANTWYLVVGFVWPYGSGTGTNHPDTGVWDTNGNLITSCYNFIWKTITTNFTYSRSYLYYSTYEPTSQQWYQPRIDLVDGTEPTLQELLNDVGNKITDLSGLTNDGNCTGSVGIGTNNNSFIFNGSGSYIDLDISNQIDQLNGTDVTVCAFIKPSAINNARAIFTARGGNSNELYFGVNSNYIHFDRYPPGGGAASSGLSPTVNQWNFVAVSATHASNARFCLNGQFATITHTEVYTGGTPTKVTIGAQLIDGVANRFYDGEISNLKVYNRALSDSEIKQIYESQRGRFGL